MITIRMKLVAAVLLGAGILGSAISQPGAERDAVKADAFGDPLPDGALARMGTLRWRHGGAVFFVGYAAEGKHLITASLDGDFRVWETATGKPLHRFEGTPDAAAPLPPPPRGRVRTRIVGEQTGPRSVVLSPDRRILAASLRDGTVRLWDVTNGKPIGRVGKAEEADIRVYGANGIAFSPDSKTLATRESDQVIHLWDVATSKEIRTLGKPDERRVQVPFYGQIGNTLTFTADGKLLAAMNTTLTDENQGVVTLWDVETGKEVRRIEGGAGSLSGRMGLHGNLLAVSWGNRTTHLFDVDTGKDVRLIGPQTAETIVQSLVFSPDGKVLATKSAGSNPTIQLWDVATGNALRSMGTQPVTGGDNVFVNATGFGSSCLTLTFSPDGKTLTEALPTNTVRVWDADSGKEVPRADGHHGAIAQMAFSSAGKTVTTRSADRTLRQWDLRSGKELQRFALPAEAGEAVLAADGNLFAFADAKNVLHFHDAATFKELRTVEVAGQPQQPFNGIGQPGISLALSPNGKVAAVRVDERTIRFYDTASGKELRSIDKQAPGAVAGGALLGGDIDAGVTPSLSFSPDGIYLASIEAAIAQDVNPRRAVQVRMFLCVWDVGTGKLLHALEWPLGSLSAFALSPDGQILVTANAEDTVAVWEVLSGKECFQIKLRDKPAKAADDNAPQPPSVIGSLTIAPDGRTLAVGGTDRKVRLFDLRSGKELGQLSGHVGAVGSLVFAADGKTLLTGSADTTALLWDVERWIKAAAPAAPLTAQRIDELWKDLAGGATEGHQAIGLLSASPSETVALIRDRVKPDKGADAMRIERLIANLEDDKFDVRQNATEALENLGELAEPALRKVLENKPGLETRQRVERILEKLLHPQPPTGDVLRNLRAVQALAGCDTVEARQLLQALAQGSPGARLTREAQAALERLARRHPSPQ